MDTPDTQRPEEETGRNDSPQQPRHNEDDCPSCGSGMKDAQFRTGSVNHPAKDTKVCTGCGTRR